MSQTLLALLQAMLRGLIQEMAAPDAAIVLPGGADSAPHLLVRVGRMEVQEWQALLREAPPSLLAVPLRSQRPEGQAAQLCLYKPGHHEWGRAARLSVSAVAAGVEYLLAVPGEEFNWMQLVASRRILSVTEEELTRLVLDIHDGPVQKLFAALNRLLHLRAIIERRAEPTDALLLPELVQGIDLLELSLNEIRSFLGAFQSADVAQRSLLDVLEALILQHEQLTNRTVYFDSAASLPSVSVPIKIALYRILQESLSNAHRHAGTDETFVRLWAAEEKLHLEVVDYGKGFVPPTMDGPMATEAAQHIGLRGMRDRVQLVGGALHLESAPGHGTRIVVTVPMD